MSVSRSHLANCAARLACCSVCTDRLGQPDRNPGDALGLVTQRAELFLEHDAVERVDPIGQRDTPVAVPEECGIGQARPDDAFITGADFRRVIAVDIADGDKYRQQLLVAAYREVALMRLQRFDQHFFR